MTISCGGTGEQASPVKPPSTDSLQFTFPLPQGSSPSRAWDLEGSYVPSAMVNSFLGYLTSQGRHFQEVRLCC